MSESSDKPTAPKPPRLGRGPAFGSDYGGGMDVRTYVATALYAGILSNPDTDPSLDTTTLASAAVYDADKLLAALEES